MTKQKPRDDLARARGVYSIMHNEMKRLYRSAKIEDLSFTIAIENDARDAISRQLMNGVYPCQPQVNLMLRLVRPGDRVLDLGAHIGAFSLPAAAMGCEVISVEASRRNIDLLKNSVSCNKFDNMKVVWAAVSDCSDASSLHFHESGPFGRVVSARDSLGTKVQRICVDELITEIGWDRVHFIKMDIEGSEVSAIQGMTKVLDGLHAPIILYESNGHVLSLYGKTPQQLKAALETFGYRNYILDSGKFIPVRSGDFQAQTVIDYLAIRNPPTTIRDWELRSPLTLDETISKILSSCSSSNEDHRAYIARALASAPTQISSRQEVINAIKKLQIDSNKNVRTSIAWSIKSKAP